ncbi:hypothetical protein PYCC9005_005009 [Savitreella phatthalungensis]
MSQRASSTGASATTKERAEWALFDNVPFALAVYELEANGDEDGNENINILYRNHEFRSKACEEDIEPLMRWILSSSAGENHTLKHKRLMRCYCRRRLENMRPMFALTMTDETLLENEDEENDDDDDDGSRTFDSRSLSSRSSSTSSLPDGLTAMIERQARFGRSSQLWDSLLRKLDPQVQQRILNIVNKASARDEAEVNHIKLLLSRAARVRGLGHPHLWSKTFWDMLTICCESPFACAIYWGQDANFLYNWHFRNIPGDRHPACLGAPAASDVCWGDIWPQIGAPFRQTWTTGDRHFVQDELVQMNRHGYIEECYFSWSITRVESHEGSPECMFNMCVDTTDHVVQGRRNQTLGDINGLQRQFESVASYVERTLDILRDNPFDIPAIAIFLPGKTGGSYSCLATQGCTVEEAQILPVIRQATEQKKFVKIDCPAFMSAEDRGWQQTCVEAIVYPMFTDDRVTAVAVASISPMKRYDASYASFFDLLFAQIGSGIYHVDLLAKKTQRLEASESKFSRLLETSPIGMYECDANGNLIYANPAFRKLVGASSELDLLDPFYAELQWVHPETRPDLERAGREFLSGRSVDGFEYRLTHGENAWVSGSATTEYDNETGKVIGCSGYLVDISERRQVELLTNRRVEEALEARRQMTNFIDMTSHEMRNPLSAIQMSCDLIIANLVNRRKLHNDPKISALIAEDLEALTNIQICAGHMNRVISDTINVSKIDAGLLTVTPVRSNVAQILANLVAMFRAETQMKGIKLEIDLDSTLASSKQEYIFDPARLSQTLINLITNSIKFTADVEGERRIVISSKVCEQKPFCLEPGHPCPRSDEMYLYFSVADTGPGMSEAESLLLFQRFSQCTPKTHIKYGGTGLGTFISRRLTELQGGEIRCRSTKGKGALFDLYIEVLPAQTESSSPTSEPEQTQIAPVRNGHKTRKHTDSDSAHTMRVLVVEDNLLNQRLLAKQLTNNHYEVEVANNGREALDKLRASTFDLMLLDREMPVCNGYECLRELRDNEAKEGVLNHLPVIAISANARPEQIEEMLGAGADGYLTKPFRFPDLQRKIGELCGGVALPPPTTEPA